ncbi:MAG: polyphenol oxidase family protein [Gemmatimonadota bacterium]|nr:polyphenol oxidase family protein [Gemmatimonadota bacterium]MDH3422059.1 polyphenol oxidase family protein [Gemmatimonadota bacterium]
MSSEPSSQRGPESVHERLNPTIPALVHSGWLGHFPWLVQGTTTRGSGSPEFDLGLFSGASPGHRVHEHWDRLLARTEMACSVHARQLHEADVRLHRAVKKGLTIADPCDGHVTDTPGVLLAVATADCVPIFVVSPEPRAVAVLHAGWRGTVAGVLERGLDVLGDELGRSRSDLHLHLGPAICGHCYEVGSEVFEALGLPSPGAPTPIDLRQILVQRAVTVGVSLEHITVSTHCTRCTDSGLFSHRGGDGARQLGYMGIRA